MTARHRVLAHTTMSFDISVLELLLPLTVGAEIVLAPCGVARDGAALRQLIESQAVDFVQSTPSSFRLLLGAGWQPHAAQRLLCGGEALSRELAEQLQAGGAELWNVYGPTETTIWSTVCRVRAGQPGPPPIGQPIDNTRLYVLDHQRRPVPTGVAGELYIGGVGVVRGYWNRPQLMAERFIEDPFDGRTGRRLYRSGDRVFWRSDGQLQYIERVDSQVKLRGFRVELGEVEGAIGQHPEIAEAAVACHQQPAGALLAAYLVARSAQAPTPEQLREFLAARLPDYMIPSAYVTLDQLPRTPAGKLDRQRLPQLEGVELTTSAQYVEPRSPLERQIADLWAEVLERPRVGVEDNFFRVGRPLAQGGSTACSAGIRDGPTSSGRRLFSAANRLCRRHAHPAAAGRSGRRRLGAFDGRLGRLVGRRDSEAIEGRHVSPRAILGTFRILELSPRQLDHTAPTDPPENRQRRRGAVREDALPLPP